MLCKICSDGSRNSVIKSTLSNILRFHQTHYEVLKLPTNCTDKQIKNAFIKLSKEHHPDVNRSKQAHAKFQRINEAYKVLGKPQSRRNYDLGLANPHYKPKHYNSTDTYEHTARNPYHDPQFWGSRDKSKDNFYENRPYYGIDGVERLPNGAIVVCCIIFTLIGVFVQYLAITRSFTFRRDDLIRKSAEAQRILNETQAAASSSGNTKQLKDLKERLLEKDK